MIYAKIALTAALGVSIGLPSIQPVRGFCHTFATFYLAVVMVWQWCLTTGSMSIILSIARSSGSGSQTWLKTGWQTDAQRHSHSQHDNNMAT
jgi:hypothetical protein